MTRENDKEKDDDDVVELDDVVSNFVSYFAFSFTQKLDQLVHFIWLDLIFLSYAFFKVCTWHDIISSDLEKGKSSLDIVYAIPVNFQSVQTIEGEQGEGEGKEDHVYNGLKFG